MEIRELLSEYDFPGDDIPVIKGSALKALESHSAAIPNAPECQCIFELMDAVDSYIPDPERADRQAFPDAGRGRVLDHWPWYCGYRPCRARYR